jgi:spore cortex formation protein SpoVR/YcgB (stage V sporulation)
MRDLRLFAIHDDEKEKPSSRSRPSTTTPATGACASRCRTSTTWASREPNIQVWNVNLRGDRSLTLRHFQHNDRPLHDSAQEVLKHVARLWGFGVHLESQRQGRRDQALDGAGAGAALSPSPQPRPSVALDPAAVLRRAKTVNVTLQGAARWPAFDRQ